MPGYMRTVKGSSVIADHKQGFNELRDYSGVRTEEGLLLTYQIANTGIRCCNDIWYATDAGGAYGIIGGYREAQLGLTDQFQDLDRVILLKDMEAVMDWVHTQAVLLPPCTVDHSIIDSRLIGPTMLAIFPGYYSERNGEWRTPVFDAFLEGLKQSSGDSYGGALVSFLECILWKGSQRQLREAIDRMPDRVLGFIAGHGLNVDDEQFWQGRYHHALLEGCRYQLAHPDEKYYHVFRENGHLPQEPLVFRLSGIREGMRLLADLGLTKVDLDAASELADLAGGDRHERRANALHRLGHKMGL